MSYQAAVITVSDRASAGVYEDKSGPAVAAMLKEGEAVVNELGDRLSRDGSHDAAHMKRYSRGGGSMRGNLPTGSASSPPHPGRGQQGRPLPQPGSLVR